MTNERILLKYLIVLIYFNKNSYLAYLFDQNSLDPFDFPSFNFEQISEYLKNEKIKDTINSILILNKLSN